MRQLSSLIDGLLISSGVYLLFSDLCSILSLRYVIVIVMLLRLKSIKVCGYMKLMVLMGLIVNLLCFNLIYIVSITCDISDIFVVQLTHSLVSITKLSDHFCLTSSVRLL